MSKLADATRAIHAGLPAPSQGEPLLPGPVLAAPFHAARDPSEVPFVYGRDGNPTWSRYEAAIGELEDGHACVFASGMGAYTTLFLGLLRAGDVLVLPSDGYFHVRELASELLRPLGVELRPVPTDTSAVVDALAGARLVVVETPSNPGLDVCDVAAVAEAASAAGALLAVDNSLATPFGQRPLGLGADFSLASATKGVSGHNDLLLGYIATRDPDKAEEVRSWRLLTGAIAGPLEVWLAHRSLATLELRHARQCDNAQALAELLADRPEIEQVRYPGLQADPAHRLAFPQMQRFGSVVSFTLATRERAERFLASLRLVASTTSFGGMHSTAERRGRWGADDVEEGFIRFSVGCEDAVDLLTDVTHALEHCGSSTVAA